MDRDETAYVETALSREAAAWGADDLVRGSVLALLGARRWHIMELADRAGMNDETLRRKLRASGEQRAFTAGEVARLALCFGVPVSDLYDGLGGRVTLGGDSHTADGPVTRPLRRTAVLQIAAADHCRGVGILP